MIARLTTAAVGIPLLVLVVWVGEPWFSVVVALFAGVVALEVCRMALNQGIKLPQLTIAIMAMILVVSHFAYTPENSPPLRAVQGIWLVMAVIAVLLVAVKSIKGLNTQFWGIGLGAVLHSGAFLAHAPLLRGIDQGLEWVFFLFIVTFSTDTAAFFVGKAIGKRPLAPTISPKKTWEGAVGGFVAAIVAATVAAAALNLEAEMVAIVILGGLMGIVGQAGDLVESKLKRLAKVKDSGWLMPGHGGVLDRLDSIVFNLVLVYYFVIWGVQ